MILSLAEIFDIVVMTLFLGFIFKDVFRVPASYQYAHDPVGYLKSKKASDFKFAALVTAPAIILHEFGHKFVAMAFGMVATFKAAYFWLGLGAVLKLMNFGFIFFVPAYVSWGCLRTDAACVALLNSNPWIGSIIAFAGPFVNLLLWLGSSFAIKNRMIKKKWVPAAVMTKRINMFLFIFNMIPIPPFDGGHVVSGLFRSFG